MGVYSEYLGLTTKSSKTFPHKPRGLSATIFLLGSYFSTLLNRRKVLGAFGRKVDFLPLLSWRLFAGFNPFHFGEYIKNNDYFGLDYFEFKSIQKLISLFKPDIKDITGTIVSGATEGNIFSAWLGKQYFLKKGIKTTYLLVTDLTHESVYKAASLLNLSVIRVLLDEEYKMSTTDLQKVISRVAKQKRAQGLMIALTLGYKETGTSDDYKTTIDVIRKHKKIYKNLSYFIWLDAAAEGLVRPFTEYFHPFKFREIKSLVFDTHKLLLTPHTTGVILYGKSLVPKNDPLESGLSESRSALPGIALWSLIESNGVLGMRRKIRHCQNLREYLDSQISKTLSPLKTISSKNSITLTYEVDPSVFNTMAALQDFFTFRCNQITLSKKRHYFLKFYFFPSIKKPEVDEFINRTLKAFKT